MLKPTISNEKEVGQNQKCLNEVQKKALDFLNFKSENIEIIYHPKTSNTFEAHEVILNRKVSIWIKPDGVFFSTGIPSANYV